MGENFSKGPALELGNWLGLDDADAVADGGLALFVMHVVLLGALDDFIELWVRNAGDMLDDDCLLHFIGNDDAYAGLTLGGYFR